MDGEDQQHTVEQIVDVHMSLETGQERACRSVLSNSFDVPQILDETTEGAKLTRHEVGVPVSPGRLAPHKRRVQERQRGKRQLHSSKHQAAQGKKKEKKEEKRKKEGSRNERGEREK